jgi:death-on-curing protein
LDVLWLERRDIGLFHGDLLERFGGLGGPPKEDALEATLARPRHLLAYKPEATIFELAAAYGYGFARNHCFPDGNKRVALAAMDVFLMLNGKDLVVDEAEVVVIVSSVVVGDVSQEQLAEWLEANSSPLSDNEI